MMTQISEFLSTTAVSFGYYPNLPIKVAFAAAIVQIIVIGIMVLSLMLMNKSTK